MEQVRIALTGIGGYGRKHVEVIAQLAQESKLRCVAFCEPHLAACQHQSQVLQSLGAKHYEDYEAMLDAHPELDAIVLVTPIPLHKPMFIEAMRRGIHVFTEKPPCIAIEDLDEMIRAAREAGRLGAVNFQNTSGPAFRLLLEHIRQGMIGDVTAVTGIGMWHRTHAYFQRARWAGQLTLNGDYVLDGPICNALSHVLQNCLIAAGAGEPRRAEPGWVQAELYRGNRIASEDTSCIRIHTRNGIQVRYYATLCYHENATPFIRVSGTEGEMIWTFQNELSIKNRSGKVQQLDFEPTHLPRNMYTNLIDVIAGREERLFCAIEDCRSFLLAANGAFTSNGSIHQIPDEAVTVMPDGDSQCTHVNHIGEFIRQASEQGKLFSELPIQWGVASSRVNMSGYEHLLLSQ